MIHTDDYLMGTDLMWDHLEGEGGAFAFFFFSFLGHISGEPCLGRGVLA